MRKKLKTLFPYNLKTDAAFQGKQLSCSFNIEDRTKFPDKHGVVYHANVLKKVEMMTMLMKRQDAFLKGC